jgi:hypothetical protein
VFWDDGQTGAVEAQESRSTFLSGLGQSFGVLFVVRNHRAAMVKPLDDNGVRLERQWRVDRPSALTRRRLDFQPRHIRSQLTNLALLLVQSLYK